MSRVAKRPKGMTERHKRAEMLCECVGNIDLGRWPEAHQKELYRLWNEWNKERERENDNAEA